MFSHLFVLFAFLGASEQKPIKLHAPSYISPKLRQLIAKRMEHHGRNAIGLTMGVVLLAHDDVGALAEAMAAQPGFARPRAGEEDTLSAALPPRFFDFQDQLRARATALAKAAASHDNAKMNAAYAKLTATCMACHSVYLDGPGAHEDWWPTDEPITPP